MNFNRVAVQPLRIYSAWLCRHREIQAERRPCPCFSSAPGLSLFLSLVSQRKKEGTHIDVAFMRKQVCGFVGWMVGGLDGVLRCLWAGGFVRRNRTLPPGSLLLMPFSSPAASKLQRRRATRYSILSKRNENGPADIRPLLPCSCFRNNPFSPFI